MSEPPYEYMLIFGDLRVCLTEREGRELAIALLPPMYRDAVREWLKISGYGNES